MKRSYLIAGILALAATGWVVSGQIEPEGSPKAARKPPADLTATQIVPTVRVRRLIAQPRQAEVILRGPAQRRPGRSTSRPRLTAASSS